MDIKRLNELLKDGDYVAWDEAMDQKINFFMRSILPLLRAKKMDDFWLSLFFPDLMKYMMTTMQTPKAVQRKVWRAMIATARENYANHTQAPTAESPPEEIDATLGDEEIMGV